MGSLLFMCIAQSWKFFILTILLVSISLLLSVVVFSVSFLLVLHFLLLSTFLGFVEFGENFFYNLNNLRISVEIQLYWHVVFSRYRNLHCWGKEVFLTIPNIHIITHEWSFDFLISVFIVPNFW